MQLKNSPEAITVSVMIKAQSKRAGGGLGPGESKHLKGSTTKPQATEVLVSL